MKKKLAEARLKGRRGWQTCRPDDLSEMLREHVDKGDPRDVANFCMFLWMLGAPISCAALSADGGERKDAEWYRLLRSVAVADDMDSTVVQAMIGVLGERAPKSNAHFDTAIDAAIAAKEKEEAL